MVRKILCLVMLSFFVAMGGFWALRAQDPQQPMPQKPASTAKSEPQTTANTNQIDLSGTYAGTFNCEAGGLVGDTTLTITGNEFTTSDGRTGHITASKSKGYTAVALQINGADATATPTVISLRGKKSGNKLTLTQVAGATQKCTFVPSKNVAKGKQMKTPAAAGTEVASPATTTPAETPVQTPSPSPTPSASPTPSGSPRPRPRPSPSPSGSPSPSPEEPMPSPTPSPSPRPRM